MPNLPSDHPVNLARLAVERWAEARRQTADLVAALTAIVVALEAAAEPVERRRDPEVPRPVRP